MATRDGRAHQQHTEVDHAHVEQVDLVRCFEANENVVCLESCLLVENGGWCGNGCCAKHFKDKDSDHFIIITKATNVAN